MLDTSSTYLEANYYKFVSDFFLSLTSSHPWPHIWTVNLKKATFIRETITKIVHLISLLQLKLKLRP